MAGGGGQSDDKNKHIAAANTASPQVLLISRKLLDSGGLAYDKWIVYAECWVLQRLHTLQEDQYYQASVF